MSGYLKSPTVSPAQVNGLQNGTTAFTTISTVGSVSAGDIQFTNAVLSAGGTFTGTGVYLTLTINGSALYIPLYQ